MKPLKAMRPDEACRHVRELYGQEDIRRRRRLQLHRVITAIRALLIGSATAAVLLIWVFAIFGLPFGQQIR